MAEDLFTQRKSLAEICMVPDKIIAEVRRWIEKAENDFRNNESLNLLVQDVQPLNRYSIEARYPGEWEPIDEFEAREALEMVRVVRGVFRRMLRSVLSWKDKE